MQVMGAVSLHRVFSFHEAYADDVERIDEIDTENTHSSGDFSSNDDSTRCYDEGKHHCTRVTYESRSLGIDTCHEECGGYNHCHERQEEDGILLDNWILIDQVELERKSGHDDEAHERETPSKTWYAIREIHRIEDEDVPTDGDKKRYIVYLVEITKRTQLDEVFIKTKGIPENPRDIGDLDACDTDHQTNEYLESEPDYRRDMDARLLDGVEIIDETDQSDESRESDDDLQFLSEKIRKIKCPRDDWCEEKKHKNQDDAYRVRCGLSFSFILVQVGEIHDAPDFPEGTESLESQP